jgi:dTDP-4-dehydrorhamnose reductase
VVRRSIVVLGAAGQLGADLLQCLGPRAVAVTHADADVRDPASLTRAIPTGTAWVINGAAFHDVDRCEDDAASAFAVNALGALNVARAAAAVGAGVTFISTDYVFDGTADRPYREDDRTAPLNVYGASKLAGEHLTRQGNPRALVARTSYLYGRRPAAGKGNLVTGILAAARRGDTLRVAREVVFSSTYTAHLAARLVELADREATGVVHVANAGAATREQFTRFVLDAAGLVAPVALIGVGELPWKARRPLYSVLASDVEARLGLAPMPDWRLAVKDYLAPGEDR